MDVHSDGRRCVLPVVLGAAALPLSGVVAGCGGETQLREAPIEVTFEEPGFIAEESAGVDEERFEGSPAVVASPIEVIDNPH